MFGHSVKPDSDRTRISPSFKGFRTMRSSSVILALAIACSFGLTGCGTSDYGRITRKITDYEVRISKDQAELATAKDTATKLQSLNSMISNTESQLKIAKRIDPASNPEFRSGSITYDAAKEEKRKRVDALEKRLADYRAQRGKLSP